MYNFLAPLLRPLVLGFFIGVFLASLAGKVLGAVWILSFFLAIVFILWGVASSLVRSRVLFLGVFFITFTLGFLSAGLAERSQEVRLPFSGSGEASVEGVIIDEPDVRDRDLRLTFRPDGSVGRLLLILPIFSQFNYGDRLRVTGRPEAPQTFETDVGRTFDYPTYLRARGIGAIIRLPKIEQLAGQGGSSFIGQLFALKAAFLNRLDRVLPEPHSSLLGGLVVGGKRSLGEIWQERLRRAGLIHLIVLSGYNLTIIGASIVWLFTALRLRQSIALSLAALAIIIFAIMVGGGASVIRAAVMALIVILARLTGRSYEAGRALVTAMVVMIIINPLILVDDIGFQLSCLATAGLIYGVPLVERWFNFIPTRFGFRSSIATTVAAQLAVFPWLLWTMGQVPLYGLITNVLVVPIVPLAMFLATVIGFAGLLLPPLAPLIAPFGQMVAAYILKITSIVAAAPGASLTLGAFPFILVILIYVGYFFIWRRSQLPLLSPIGLVS